MKPSSVWSKESLAAALLCAAAGLAAPLAVAQQPAAAPSAQPAPPPPELEKLEEGEPPAVTIRKPGDDNSSSGNSIKEQRDHGQTKEIEVKSGPSTYYIRPNKNLGGSTPGDAQSAPATSAQWKVGEFDWGVKKKAEQDGDAAADTKK
ncbi:hypothetical protein Herbaro_01995 [Herbaspirillum sp. WKF16]|uniref:hypothetical protein n=1 Tax=Herbaspirillum sp. WKF16 TaxID=3028312 RepID=UPI0023A92CA6|nr:hypothetical protein [Herbaspirillum sp. WKF16]WDZ96577.1 hypothetical protein Herbaro_01995 [Herbaspirillum sp. WKF16]